MPSPEYESFVKLLFSAPPPQDTSLEELRDMFEKRMSGYRPSSDVELMPCKIGSLDGLWVRAPGADREKVILFFYGGGYMVGSVQSHQEIMARISAASQCTVLGTQYRLAPEYPYPAAVEDALTAYQWLLKQMKSSKQIALAGCSAGGGLALALLLKLKEKKIPLPSCACLIAPWVDLTMQGDSVKGNIGKDILNFDRLTLCRDVYVDKQKASNPEISPLFGDLTGLPPLFIQIGTHDMLYSESMRLAEKARKAGVEVVLDEWSDMIHTFALFARDFPEGREGIQRAGSFLKSKIG